jgi:hypothetical protein
VPGAIAAGLDSPLFSWSPAISLLIAGVVAHPVNRWLIARGKAARSCTPTTTRTRPAAS